MKFIKILKGLFKQSSKDVYEYGCVMLYLDFPQMEEIHNSISKEDVYVDEQDPSYGLEKEPHVTLLYGLHKGIGFPDIIRKLKSISFQPPVLGSLSLFENEKYDVLKFDVSGEFLNEANQALRSFPHTNSYSDYKPHMTVAYLKPGTGKKYITKTKLEGSTLVPKEFVYSTPSGEKLKSKIKSK